MVQLRLALLAVAALMLGGEARTDACSSLPEFSYVGVFPTDGAVDMPTNVRIRILHQGAFNGAELLDVVVRDATGADVLVATSMLPAGRQALVEAVAAAPLAPGQVYEVLGRIQPECGADCVTADYVRYGTFTTGAGPEVAQAPGRTDPYHAPDLARARRDEVLERMLRAGMIDASAHTAAIATPLALRPPRDVYGTVAPWMTEQARREIETAYPLAYARGGLDIHTTVQPAAAVLAEAAAARGADRVAARQKSARPQVAVFAWDHVTGYVETTVGGLDWQTSRFDRATQACRQPGSAFKPIVYVAALEEDAITPGTPLRDAPIAEYDEDRDVFWKPHNSGKSFRGIAIAQDALAASLNAPAVDVLDRVGAAAAIDMARRLGITSPLDPVRPLVLGASCVIPADLARAYGAFAARGRATMPAVVTRVVARGEIVLDRGSPYDPYAAADRRLDRLVTELDARAAAPVIDDVTAFLMSSMLAAVVNGGTGRDARVVGRPAAGKTGTTNDNSDAWFVGWTGRLVTAVWLGHDDPVTKLGRREDGSHAALPIWVDVVRGLEAERTPLPVPGPPPDGVVTARVDRATGLLASSGAGGAAGNDLWLWFRNGTAPTEQVDDVREVPRELDRVTRDF